MTDLIIPEAETIDLVLYRHRATGAAIHMSDNGDEGQAVWLPLSKIKIHPAQRGEAFRVTLPKWLALEKMLIGNALPGQKDLF